MWKESTSPTPKFHVTNSLSDLLALDTMHCIRLLPPPQLVNIRAYPLSSGNPPLRTLSGVPNDISPSWFALWIVIHTKINSINGIQPNSTAREMGVDIPPQYICSSSDCWQAPHTSVSLEEIPFQRYVMRSLNWVPSRILSARQYAIGHTTIHRGRHHWLAPSSIGSTIRSTCHRPSWSTKPFSNMLQISFPALCRSDVVQCGSWGFKVSHSKCTNQLSYSLPLRYMIDPPTSSYYASANLVAHWKFRLLLV